MLNLSNEAFIAIAVGVAVGIVSILSIILYCVYRAYSRVKRRSGKHVVDIEMMEGSPIATMVVLQEVDEQNVAKRAFRDSGNVLWTNEGKVYLTSGHPEEQFISDNTDPSSVTSLYVKHSPCSSCCSKLIKHFASCERKPVIYIGKISQLRDTCHKKGLQQLLKHGFQIQVWQILHDMMFSTKMTENYIQKLKK